MINRKKKANDLRIAKKRAAGKTMAQIAKEEGISAPAVFLALKRIKPELKAALGLNKYDLNVAVRKMVEMTNAKKTEYFQHQGIVLDKRVVQDNPTRFAARKEMLRVHGVGQNGDDDKSNGNGNNTPQVVINLGFLDAERAFKVLGIKPGGESVN